MSGRKWLDVVQGVEDDKGASLAVKMGIMPGGTTEFAALELADSDGAGDSNRAVSIWGDE